MLEQVLTHIHNWFRVQDPADGIHPGVYVIRDGCITLPFLRDGQYFRIMGSAFNDGLHRYDLEPLHDETFDGTVWALAIPRDVEALAAEMEEWETKYGAKAAGMYKSETFAGYTYAKYTNGHGSPITVWDVFQGRLNLYRRLREVRP